jgi:hypothetical protein
VARDGGGLTIGLTVGASPGHGHLSGVYNKAQHLPERWKIMHEWADYLELLKSGGKASQQEEIE